MFSNVVSSLLDQFEDGIWDLNSVRMSTDEVDIDDEFWVEINQISMILHPLSDLTKPITVSGYNDGEEFVPILELAKILGINNVNLFECDGVDIYGWNEECFVSGEITEFALGWDAKSKKLAVYDTEPGDNPLWDYASYEMFQLLFQWHFDIFGLIERGDAVDINTLEQK